MQRNLSTLLALSCTIALAAAVMAGEGNGRPQGDLKPMSIAFLETPPTRPANMLTSVSWWTT